MKTNMIRNLGSGTATLSSSVVKDNIISTLKELDSLIVGFWLWVRACRDSFNLKTLRLHR